MNFYSLINIYDIEVEKNKVISADFDALITCGSVEDCIKYYNENELQSRDEEDRFLAIIKTDNDYTPLECMCRIFGYDEEYGGLYIDTCESDDRVVISVALGYDVYKRRG